MRIDVVYSPSARRVETAAIDLPAGATVAAALRGSGWWPDGMLPTGLTVGVWGRVRTADHELRDGDRVEIYRDLLVDPKEARRGRARRSKKPPR